MDLQHSVRKPLYVLGLLGVWHEKPTFVAFCGLMCSQNDTCVACGLVVALRACFPQKIAFRSEDHLEFLSL